MSVLPDFGAMRATSSVGCLRGAYLAMCVCAAVLRCHTRNLLRCGLFEGANLAVHVCAAVLRCHMYNLLLSGLFHFTFSYILHDSVHSYSF